MHFAGCSCFNEAAGIPRGRRPVGAGRGGAPRASMRPRVFPAEDVRAHGRGRVGHHASMRPRVFPAEDRRHVVGLPPVVQASMRPRVFPAEDSGDRLAHTARRSGFNEAAGIPRGRLLRHCRLHCGCRGFNEAAGIPRGRRPPAHPIERGPPGFNEAAGIPRGRHTARVGGARRRQASMRPRVFPAEDGDVLALHGDGRRASMRPRVFPAED